MYPLPIIGKIMKQLECFHYVTALNLNMGYYNTKNLRASQEKKTVVTEFTRP